MMNKDRLNRPDCPFCEEHRKIPEANFCGRCGKQLKENPIIKNYWASEKSDRL